VRKVAAEEPKQLAEAKAGADELGIGGLGTTHFPGLRPENVARWAVDT
jgi:hypothetical protein